ncbi:hypothetical protein MLD38_023076 [Melastoma candidum]|uniref:Uncharacterized protein n=1 Tax=Melastoma candidum TaxID=119954 RepID=A0ACB9QPT9_9MYRT|nr:hypothetical protein MLD38_023076 [Melastoma candidum]
MDDGGGMAGLGMQVDEDPNVGGGGGDGVGALGGSGDGKGLSREEGVPDEVAGGRLGVGTDLSGRKEAPLVGGEEGGVVKEVGDEDMLGKEMFMDEDVKEEKERLRGQVRWETQYEDGDVSGTEEEQREFRKEVESYYKQRGFEFRAPKFYKEELNLLKLYRAVIKLGGYEQVTSCKLWRQVGAPFRPPKTCTTVSWTFRNFYEKALLEYEKHRMRCGELPFLQDYIPDPKADHQVNQTPGSGRTLRDAAARAMQGWQSHGLVNWEEKRESYSPRSDKQPKGVLKHKKPFDGGIHRSKTNAPKPQLSSVVVDVGPPADWVKINVYKINDCFEIYALVPGLLREEVHVQSDPAGRLIISGQPQQADNPWGVTPFKKLVSLPSRIDPHQTSAVVTMNGQLYLRVPFEQKES